MTDIPQQKSPFPQTVKVLLDPRPQVIQDFDLQTDGYPDGELIATYSLEKIEKVVTPEIKLVVI